MEDLSLIMWIVWGLGAGLVFVSVFFKRLPDAPTVGDMVREPFFGRKEWYAPRWYRIRALGAAVLLIGTLGIVFSAALSWSI